MRPSRHTTLRPAGDHSQSVQCAEHLPQLHVLRVLASTCVNGVKVNNAVGSSRLSSFPTRHTHTPPGWVRVANRATSGRALCVRGCVCSPLKRAFC